MMLRWVCVLLLAVSIAAPVRAQLPGPPLPPVKTKDDATSKDAPKDDSTTAALPSSDPFSATIKWMFGDMDPGAFYPLIPALMVWRALRLPDLLVSHIPNSRRARDELRNWRANTEEAQRIADAIEKIKRESPNVLHDLAAATRAYNARTEQLDIMLEELRGLPQLTRNPTINAEMNQHIEHFREFGDPTPFLEWFRSRRNTHFRNGAAGSWAQKFDLWLKLERQERNMVRLRSNRITEILNEGLSEKEKYPTLTMASADGDTPGRLNLNGTSERVQDVLRAAILRCKDAIGLLDGRAINLHGRAGRLGLLVQGFHRVRPLGSAVLTGGAVYLPFAVYWDSYRRHGKAPSQVQQEQQQQQRIEQEQVARAETSLEVAVVKRKDEIKPYTDRIAAVLRDHQEDIFDRVKTLVKDIKKRRDVDIDIDWAKKKALFENDENLAFHIIRALPPTALEVNGNINMDQLIKFLSLPPRHAQMLANSRVFAGTLYMRILDSLFPELRETAIEGRNVVTNTAGKLLDVRERQDGPSVRENLVEDLLNRMPTMRLRVPPNVPPHSSIPPDLDPAPAPPAAAPNAAAPVQGAQQANAGSVAPQPLGQGLPPVVVASPDGQAKAR